MTVKTWCDHCHWIDDHRHDALCPNNPFKPIYPSPAPAVGELVTEFMAKWNGVSFTGLDGHHAAALYDWCIKSAARIEQLEAGLTRIKRVAMAEDGIERSAIGTIIEVSQIARALLKGTKP